MVDWYEKEITDSKTILDKAKVIVKKKFPELNLVDYQNLQCNLRVLMKKYSDEDNYDKLVDLIDELEV